MPGTRDESWLEHALSLAEEHSRDGRQGPFGAVITREDTLVGEGWNQVVSSRDPSAHAEIVALRDACRNLDTHVLTGCTLYSSCEPCPMCLAAIYWSRIDRLVFACRSEDAARAGFDDGKILAEIRKDWPERELNWTQSRRETGLRVFEAWLQNPDRIEY